MSSNTPTFWYKRTGFFPRLLSFLAAPFAFFYRTGDKINRSLQASHSVDIPVICIGNLNIGGAGKTPTCIALSKIITEHNDFMEPNFLTRGYGGNVLGPEYVDLSRNASIWGDEALLLNKHAKTIVSQNRYHGAELATHRNTDIIIMDDGFQNNSLKKDISFIVVDGTYGFGNQKTIPAGPLREPLEIGLNKADAFIIIGEDNYGIEALIPKGKSIFKATVKVKTGWKANKKKAYIAFCGIAHPQKFKNTLETKGLDIKKMVSFPDHHTFTNSDLKKLEKRAKKDKALLITTEKDLVRLPDGDFKGSVLTLPIEAHFSAKEKKALLFFIKQQTKSRKEV